MTTAAALVPVLATANADSATSGGDTGATDGMAAASDPIGGADASGNGPAGDAGSGSGTASSFDFESALNSLFGSNASSFDRLSDGVRNGIQDEGESG